MLLMPSSNFFSDPLSVILLLLFFFLLVHNHLMMGPIDLCDIFLIFLLLSFVTLKIILLSGSELEFDAEK